MSKETEPRQRDITSHDFVTGVLSSSTRWLGSSYYLDTRDPKVHAAMAETFEKLREQSNEQGLRLHFSIRPHPIHGDSPTLSGTFSTLLQNNELPAFISPYLGTIKLDFNVERTEAVLSSLPGSRELYDELADTFIRTLYGPVETPQV